MVREMNKFSLIEDPAGVPERLFALPELHYPRRLNVTRALFERVDREGWADRPALYSGHRRVSFGALQVETRRYAAALEGAGLHAGDRIVLRMADAPELVFTILAAQALGAVVVATFAQLRSDDLLYRVRDTDARLAVVAADLLEEFLPVVEEKTSLSDILVVPGDTTGRFRSLPASPS